MLTCSDFCLWQKSGSLNKAADYFHKFVSLLKSYRNFRCLKNNCRDIITLLPVIKQFLIKDVPLYVNSAGFDVGFHEFRFDR